MIQAAHLREFMRESWRHLSAAVEQERVEYLLGLSQGYLSHVKAGRHAPSPMLVAELVLLAKHVVGADRAF